MLEMTSRASDHFQPWTATILGHDEEIYSTEAATEIPIC